MKRCPQCGREYDSTMTFCLDDGAELLYGPASDGPASMDEPQTAILPEAGVTGESPTRTLEPDESAETAVLPKPDTAERPAASRKRKIVAAAGLLAIVAIAVGGYWMYGGVSSEQINSIAVMPFVNDSGDDEVEYLSDGMTETLISSLSTLPNVSVKARSTVFFYKGKAISPRQLGKDLNVEAVLLGKVSGRGDDLRLNLELVNTETEDVIWSETYDRKQSDLVALQSEVAREVSSKILEKLSGDQEQRVSEMGTTDPKAYQAYLKGRFYWNQRGKVNLKRAIDEFKAATNIDPKYALAYAAMGETYAILAGYSGERREDTFPQARENAERAIALNDRLASPQAALGLIEQQSWNWKLAEEHFRKAIELDPNYPSAYHWYSILLRSVGRLDEAAEMINRAKELDPLSSIIAANVSETLLLQGKPQASIDNSLKIIELTPNFPAAYSNLGFAYLKTGNPEKAVSEFEKAASFEDDSYQTAFLGYAYGIAGNRTEAEKILVALKKDHSAGKTSEKDVAVVLLGLGEKDKAIDWLEKSFEARNPLLKNISWELPFESLHSDPRFKSLLKRMGLPDA